MAYLLDLLLPGLGHLGLRRIGSGLLLLLFWALGVTAGLVAASFCLWALVTLAAWHAALALVACLHARRLRRRGEAAAPRALAAAALLLLAPALAFGALFASGTFLARPITIRSGSMEPGIWTGDTIVGQIFWPWVGEIRLGDVVLVVHPGRPGRLLIKRVVGMAGDLIQVRSGEIHRNGRPLAQCALRSLRDPESRQQVVERLEVLDRHPYLVWDQPASVSHALTRRVPPGHVFVLGDNRDRSGDSRTFGPVPIALVRGRVLVGVAPPRNAVDRAPESARRAALAQCARRRGDAAPRQAAPR